MSLLRRRESAIEKPSWQRRRDRNAYDEDEEDEAPPTHSYQPTPVYQTSIQEEAPIQYDSIQQASEESSLAEEEESYSIFEKIEKDQRVDTPKETPQTTMGSERHDLLEFITSDQFDPNQFQKMIETNRMTMTMEELKNQEAILAQIKEHRAAKKD